MNLMAAIRLQCGLEKDAWDLNLVDLAYLTGRGDFDKGGANSVDLKLQSAMGQQWADLTIQYDEPQSNGEMIACYCLVEVLPLPNGCYAVIRRNIDKGHTEVSAEALIDAVHNAIQTAIQVMIAE